MSNFDRVKALKALEEWDERQSQWDIEPPDRLAWLLNRAQEDLLDALEACVRPAPQQIIDRAALIILLLDEARGTHLQAVPLADRVLALLRPVDGVVLTREEAALVRRCLLDEQYEEPDYSACHALVRRLEAAL